MLPEQNSEEYVEIEQDFFEAITFHLQIFQNFLQLEYLLDDT